MFDSAIPFPRWQLPARGGSGQLTHLVVERAVAELQVVVIHQIFNSGYLGIVFMLVLCLIANSLEGTVPISS
jgi:hypothetical protein